MCNKIFSSAFNDPLKYSKLSVSSIFYGITAGRDQWFWIFFCRGDKPFIKILSFKDGADMHANDE